MYSYDPPDDQDLSDPPEEDRMGLPRDQVGSKSWPFPQQIGLADTRPTQDPAEDDVEWALLAEAVERGDWPETEVEL